MQFLFHPIFWDSKGDRYIRLDNFINAKNINEKFNIEKLWLNHKGLKEHMKELIKNSMKVALLGNMNNNNYSMLRYLRDKKIEAFYFYLMMRLIFLILLMIHLKINILII